MTCFQQMAPARRKLGSARPVSVRPCALRSSNSSAGRQPGRLLRRGVGEHVLARSKPGGPLSPGHSANGPRPARHLRHNARDSPACVVRSSAQPAFQSRRLVDGVPGSRIGGRRRRCWSARPPACPRSNLRPAASRLRRGDDVVSSGWRSNVAVLPRARRSQWWPVA